MEFVALWAVGLTFSLTTVHLTLARRDWPPNGPAAVDKPLNRVLVNSLGWAVFTMVMIFAIYLDGIIWPPLFAALVWVVWRLARNRANFTRLYFLAAPIGFAGLFVTLLLFQTVFGDDFFGLANIFPDG